MLAFAATIINLLARHRRLRYKGRAAIARRSCSVDARGQLCDERKE